MRLRATLCYEDPARAAAFYVNTCGFAAVPGRTGTAAAATQGDEAGEPPAVRRGGAELLLMPRAAVPATSPLGRRLGRPAGSGVRLEILLGPEEKIEDLFLAVERAGADIVEPLGEWAPGEISFTVADPGNYLVRFVRPSAPR